MWGRNQGCAHPRIAPAWAALLLLPVLLGALLLGPRALADDIPALTGRVIDNAAVLGPEPRREIDAMLAALQQRSEIQLIVATVPSLGGRDIESFANGLFRAWKLGDARRNDGVLLLVAPTEHKVRIEVGYGLEGTLTDALSSQIIADLITPAFKAGDFERGIRQGVAGIITVLTGEGPALPAPIPRLPLVAAAAPSMSVGTVLMLGFFAVLLSALSINAVWSIVRPARRTKGRQPGAGRWSGSDSSSSSSDRSSSSSDSGTSGGGGSSGGGGASGSW